MKDKDVDLVLNTTRHNLHSSMTVEILNAGKHVFVEKPLALNEEELQEVINAYKNNSQTITVGFNRRFSPHVKKMKRAYSETLL